MNIRLDIVKGKLISIRDGLICCIVYINTGIVISTRLVIVKGKVISMR